MEFIVSNLSWFWLGVLVVCIAIEAATMALTTIWAGLAATPMIFISRTALPFRWQLLIFAVLTVVLIVFTRPFAVKKLKTGKENSTNVNALIGQEVVVVSPISQFKKGEAKTKNGVVWTSESFDGSEIAENEVCKIKAVNGNTLVLERCLA